MLEKQYKVILKNFILIEIWFLKQTNKQTNGYLETIDSF